MSDALVRLNFSPEKKSKKSPSQIDTFISCQRKWAWGRIHGKRPPPNKSAALGLRIHDVLEDWLRDGIPLPDNEEGKILMPGLIHFPAPGLAIPEEPFEFETEIALFNGRKDARFLNDETGLHVVADLKTTSGLQWAKSAEDLHTDPQGVIYAEDEFRARPDLDKLELRWVYVLTRGKRASRRVSTVVERSRVAEEFARIEEIAAEMVSIELSGATALDLPPTVSTCEAYGGCPFVGDCNLSPTERMAAFMAQETIKEKMARRAAERAAANGGAAPAASAAPKTKATPTPAASAAPVNTAAPEVMGLCSCGAEVALNAAGRLKAHRRPENASSGAGLICPGAGNYPMKPEAMANEPPAINPASEPLPEPEEVFEEPPKAAPTATKAAAPAPAPASTPPATGAPAASLAPLLSAEQEDLLVLRVLEEVEPGAVRAARNAVASLLEGLRSI